MKKTFKTSAITLHIRCVYPLWATMNAVLTRAVEIIPNRLFCNEHEFIDALWDHQVLGADDRFVIAEHQRLAHAGLYWRHCEEQ